jgi:hypothetical protein
LEWISGSLGMEHTAPWHKHRTGQHSESCHRSPINGSRWGPRLLNLVQSIVAIKNHTVIVLVSLL